MILEIVGITVAIFVLWLLYFKFVLLRPKGLDLVLTSAEIPKLTDVLPRLIPSLIFKKEGVLASGFKTVPKLSITINKINMSEAKHKQYMAVCKAESAKVEEYKVISPCFPAILVFTCIPKLVTLPQFPISPLGLIHYKSVITVWKDINIGDDLDINVQMDGHRVTEKGIEVDIIITGTTQTGERVYQCIETVLSRKKVKRSSGRPRPSQETEQPTVDEEKSVRFAVGSSLGLKFAAASGDYSPQHLYPWSAKLIGFKRAIAHGMWELEKCISELKAASVFPSIPYTIDCAFKLPLYMPSKVLFTYDLSADGSVDFKLTSDDGKLPHAVGKAFGAK